MNILTISKSNKEYPDRLNHLHKPPEKILLKGADINNLLQSPTVGVVGSRKVTNYGRAVTKELADFLAKKGVTIVSGLAFGVDSLAHKATVEAKGETISVLPGSLEKIYPASHTNLAQEIMDSSGTLLSEYSGKSTPMRHQFIERNRIIAALSDVLLITEAAEKSGSLHTAKFALELGRTVAAVPGSVYNPMSSGCNNLIKSGAHPVTSGDDMTELLGLDVQPSLLNEYYPENEEEKAILDLINSGVGDGTELAVRSNIQTELHQQTISMLEIKGVITSVGNNQWKIK